MASPRKRRATSPKPAWSNAWIRWQHYSGEIYDVQEIEHLLDSDDSIGHAEVDFGVPLMASMLCGLPAASGDLINPFPQYLSSVGV